MKPFKNLDEQIEILKSRGLKFNDENKAKKYLYTFFSYFILFFYVFYHILYFIPFISTVLFNPNNNSLWLAKPPV